MTNFKTLIKKKLLEDIKSFPFDYSYDEYTKLNYEINEHFKHYGYINTFYKLKFKAEKEYFKFIILKNSLLVLSLKYYFENSQKAEEDYLPTSYSYKCINDFWKIFTVISNNYLVLKDLLLNGKDFQAKTIFRNTIELTELCICILGNEEFYNFFKKKNDIEEPKKMFQTLKFNTIKKTTNTIINEIKDIPSNNLPSLLWDNYLELRQDFYEDSSRHIHSNFLNLMLGSHVEMIETDAIEVKELLIHNLGGVINTETEKSLKNIFTYDSISYTIILIMLIEKHKLFFGKLDKNAYHLTVLSKYNWELLGKIINKNHS